MNLIHEKGYSNDKQMEIEKLKMIKQIEINRSNNHIAVKCNGIIQLLKKKD